MIPPDAQRLMSKRAGSTTVEVKGSHAVYESQPKAVAALIENAARPINWKPVPIWPKPAGSRRRPGHDDLSASFRTAPAARSETSRCTQCHPSRVHEASAEAVEMKPPGLEVAELFAGMAALPKCQTKARNKSLAN